MADDNRPTSSPTVLFSANQTDTDVPVAGTRVGSDNIDPRGNVWQLAPWQVASTVGAPGDQPANDASANTNNPTNDALTGESKRPSGVISLDDPDLKLMDPDVLDAMPDEIFFPKAHEWLDALHGSFDYDTTLVPEQKLTEVPLLGTTAVNLTTTNKHFSADNDANRVNPSQLYFAEATLMVLALTRAIAKRTAHRPDLDSFRGEFSNAEEKAWLEEIAQDIFEDEFIDERKFDTNEATLKIKRQITEAKETAEKVAPYLVTEDDNREPEKSDERDVRVEKTKPEEEIPQPVAPAIEPTVEITGESDSALTEEEQAALEARVPGFNELISPEIPAVVAYLEAAFRASGVPVPDAATLETFARAQLANLDADTLMGIAAGIPLYREKYFSSISKDLLSQYSQQQQAEVPLIQEMALNRLRGVIALRLSDGLTADEILEELAVLSSAELGIILGLEITAQNEDAVRVSIRERATQLLIAVFSSPPTGIARSTTLDRARTSATYSSIAPGIKEKNDEIEENLNRAAEGNKTTGEKVQSFLKAYQKSWTMLTQDEQIMVYLLADLPIGDKLFEPNKPLDLKLPLPFQFVTFAYSTYGKEFQTLVKKFQLDPKEFKRIYKDSNLKYQLISSWSNKKSATNTVEYLKTYAQQESELQLDVYKNLPEPDRQKIAIASGFSSATAFELQLIDRATNPSQYAGDGFVSEVATEMVDGGVEYEYVVTPNALASEERLITLLDAENAQEMDAAFAQFNAEDQANEGESYWPEEYLPTEGSPDIFTQSAVSQAGVRQGLMGRGKQMARERVGQAFKGARQKMVKKVGQTATKQLAKQGVKAAGKAAAGATAGLSWVATELATNKKLRDAALIAATALTGFALDSLGTVWGMAGGAAGAAAGFFMGGPMGVAIGTPVGAIGGRLFGDSLGWNPRIFGARQYPLGQSPSELPMSSINGTRGGGAGGFTEGSGGAATSPQAFSAAPSMVSSAPLTPTAAAAPAAASVAATAASAISGLVTAAALPALAISGIFFITMFTLTVIWGAFLVPSPEEAGEVPDRPGGPNAPGIPVNPYITVRKFATPTTLPNNTPTTVNYTIQVESKSGYVVKVNSFTDTFSSMGDQVPPNLTPPLAGTEFGDEKITSGKEVTYTMQLSGVDALITNSVTVLFDVYPVGADTPIRTNQKAMARASVTIGSPKLACWPASGQLTQLEGGSFSHVGYDAIDIVAMPGLDWNVYAPIAGEACPIEQNKRLDPITGAWIYSGYGRYIKMQGEFQGKQVTLIFGHFSTYLSGLEPGSCQFVQPGTPLGIMDSTGFSTADHLHYELRPGSGLKLRDLIAGSENIRVGDNVTTCFSP